MKPPARLVPHVAALVAFLLALGGTAGAKGLWDLVGPPAPGDDLAGAHVGEEEPAGQRIRVVKLAGPIAEAVDPWDVFGLDTRVVVSELLHALREEAEDDSVGTILLKVRPSGLGLSQAREVAAAIRHAQRKGRRVVAHLVSPGLADLVACAGADELLLAPEGQVLVPGLRAELAYYKDLLSTLGVEADIEAVGRYKSAAEPLMRSSISEEAREAIDALLDGAWTSVVADVAKGRKLPVSKTQALLDQGLLTAHEATKRGLVHRLESWQATKERLGAAAGMEPQLAYPKPARAPDMGSIFGLLKLLSEKKGRSAQGDARIAILVAEGAIVLGSKMDDPFGGGGMAASDDLLEAIEEARADESVKAVVLRVQSPGGSALASDMIWQALRRLGEDKPLVASLGDVAASGGYYIASAARKIVAQPTTVTGSIGVFGGKLVLGGVYEKLGITTVTFSRGRNAGLFSTMSRFSESERAAIRRSMKRTYNTFVNRVARGRQMSYDAIDRVAEGRVWVGVDAHARGLVDRLGGLEAAVALAAREAGLGRDTVEVVPYPRPRSLMELFEAHGRRITSPSPIQTSGPGGLVPSLVAALAAQLGEELLPQVLQMHALLAKEPVLALTPFAIRLR